MDVRVVLQLVWGDTKKNIIRKNPFYTFYKSSLNKAALFLFQRKEAGMNFDYFYNRQSEMYNFIRLPMVLMEDEIFESISIEAKVLYSYMLNRMGLSYKNGWIDEDGKVFIYYTIESIKDQFNCASEKANKLIAELDIKSGIGLIEKKRQGLGKPNRIYVKDFMSIFNNMELKNQEVRKTKFQKFDNRNSRDSNIEIQDFRKSESNYNNISNNELRNNDFSKGQKPYGIYKNIFLTDEDYKDLTNELGSRINEYIDRLSSYMKANNREYQDHKATIINWYLNDQAKNINDNTTRKMNYYIGESLWRT